MRDAFSKFAQIVRKTTVLREESRVGADLVHPFDERNIHPALPQVVRSLFDDGHYAQATFEAFKFVDKEVSRHAKSSESGFRLMMDALKENNPPIKLTPMKSASEKDEQKGYQFLFAGSMLAIRNPRGHEYGVVDTPDTCLDHLGFASQLLRRLEKSGYK